MPEPIRLYLDAAALEPRGQLRQLTFHRDRNVIALDDRVLVEDDAPAIGRPQGAADDSWFERLCRGVVIRKDLVLDDPRARAAWLVFCGREATGNQHPLHLRLNGHHLIRPPTRVAHPQARHYYTTDWGNALFDNWFVVPLPVGALRAGTNEIHLWAESGEPSWEIMVAADQEYARGSDARTAHPDRSAKSTDGGQTWDSEHLGWQGLWDGEHCVRLSLERYVCEGLYRSPVIDLAESGSQLSLTSRVVGTICADPLKRLLAIERCRAEWDLAVPDGCAAQVRARFGPSPRPGADSWSAFEPVEGNVGDWKRLSGRYLQFEVTLSTADPLCTPELRGVSIETDALPPTADPAAASAAASAAPSARVFSFRSGRVVRSSFDYTWEDFARLADLRRRFELDDVVRGAATEFEAQVRLMRWAYTVPLGELDRHAWRFDDLPQVQRDANGQLVGLGPYDRRRRDGHCLYCNLTLVAACLAMGHPARWVNVSTRHTYGHEVCEVWSNDFDKWVFLDATRDYYLYDPDTGIPLGLTEISDRLGRLLPEAATWEFPVQHWLPDGARAEDMGVACPQGGHTFPVFDPQVGSEDLILIGHLQMPLRNDFASRPTPVPWRLSSNWGSDQFCCWYSDRFPRKEEYARHTRRWQDFSPTLNQTELFLSETGEGHPLRVEVDTETPCFDCFLVQVDGGEWREQVEPIWDWPLHAGLNQVRVRVRNRAGVCGPVSHVSVVAHA